MTTPMKMEVEILSDEELVQITGYKTRAGQRRWLIRCGWHYVESRGGRPLVGRQYMRLKLSNAVIDVAPSTAPSMPKATWIPDFSRVK